MVREFELVVARIGGELCAHDLRFSTRSGSEPVMLFDGHVNGYSTHTVTHLVVLMRTSS
jgi:hypothetical protein